MKVFVEVMHLNYLQSLWTCCQETCCHLVIRLIKRMIRQWVIYIWVVTWRNDHFVDNMAKLLLSICLFGACMLGESNSFILKTWTWVLLTNIQRNWTMSMYSTGKGLKSTGSSWDDHIISGCIILDVRCLVDSSRKSLIPTAYPIVICH